MILVIDTEKGCLCYEQQGSLAQCGRKACVPTKGSLVCMAFSHLMVDVFTMPDHYKLRMTR
jgi:hypothetical protein